MSTTPADVAAAWAPIEAWLRSERPDLAEGLKPAASTDALDELASLGVPAEWRALWSQHDGEGPVLLGGWSFLPVEGGVESVLVEHDNLLEMARHLSEEAPPSVVGPVRPLWGHRGWVPFATDYSGRFLCIDLAPPHDGQMGQVLLVDESRRQVIYPGLLDLLDECRSRMEDGFHPDDDLDLWSEELPATGPTAATPNLRSSEPNPPPPKVAEPTPPAKAFPEPELRGAAVLTDGVARLDIVLTRPEQAEGTTAFVRQLDDNIIGVMIPKGGHEGAQLCFPGLGGEGHDLLVVVASVQ